MSQKQCFVMSPIGQKGSEIRGHADDVFEFIIQAVMSRLSERHYLGIKAERADHIQAIGPLSKQMFDRIINADLCIALLTGHSPNVFYELAVAQVLAWVESHLHALHKVAGKLGFEEVAPTE